MNECEKNDYGNVLFGIIVKYPEDMIILNIKGFIPILR